MGLRDGHANGHGHTCAQGAGGGLNARGVAVLRVSGGQGIQLAEIHQILFGKSAAEHVQQGVEQGGAVAAGKDETVAVFPVQVGGIEIHVVGPQLVGCGSSAQGQAGVAGVGLLHHIRGQNPQGVY